VARYRLSCATMAQLPATPLAVGALLVNVLGCLAVGILGALVVKHDLLSDDTRLLLFSGLAGGFTTFSAFGLETFHLLRRGETLVAGSYIVLTAVLGMLAVWRR